MIKKNIFDIKDIKINDLKNIIKNKLPKKKVLKNKVIGLIFEKPSTRTRLSFSVGITRLGGSTIDINFNELNFSRNESIEDTFKAINCYVDGLVYRTSSHEKLLIAEKYFKKPIINGLSEKSHPCQIISDLFTLYKKFKTLKLHIVWIGDINNVLFSLIEAAELIQDIKLDIISDPHLIKKNELIQKKPNINYYPDMNNKILSSCDCIMTDVFLSMNDNNNESKEKSKLLKKFQVNSKIMNYTKPKCVFMHCLPAKIGEEVTLDVIDSNKSIVWEQAKNRMLSQISLMRCIDW